MLDKLQIYLQIIVDYLLQVGLVGGFLLIVLESIIPALPLCFGALYDFIKRIVADSAR